MFCTNCGTQVPDDALFCTNCGHQFAQAGASSQGVVNTNELKDGIMKVYKNAIDVFCAKPVVLFGLILMYAFLSGIAATMGGPVPIIALVLVNNLQIGVCALYLGGLRKEEVSADLLFQSFNNHFFRNAFSIFWRNLWIGIWAFISIFAIIIGVISTVGAFGFSIGGSDDIGSRIGQILGVLIAVVLFLVGIITLIGKIYAYCFVPYIVLNDQEISAANALKESMRLTKGLKLKMFLADILAGIVVMFGNLILFGIVALLAKSEVAILVIIAVVLAVALLLVNILINCLFFGILRASFYDSAVKNNK